MSRTPVPSTASPSPAPPRPTSPTGAAWAPSGHPSYGNASTFYQPQFQTDPFGTTATLTWDLHHLRMTTVEISLGGPSHTASVVLDASTLQPAQLTDLNGVRTAVTFDALGRVTKTATLGRSGTTVDDLDHPTAAFDYTFATFADGVWTPACAHARVRRTHWGGATPDDGVHDEVWSYTDGLGRPLMSKAPVAPDPATPTTPRYVGTGRVLLDAKGQPVKQYEPYVSSTSGWEPEAGFEGVTPVLHYDPLGRPVRTDHPDGTHERIVRTPWEERHFDRNDTVPTVPDVDFVAEVAAGTWVWPDFEEAMESAWAAVASHPWLLSRAVATEDPDALPPVTAERAAALRQSALQSYSVRDTPTVVHTDVLGRPFLEQRSMSTDAPTATTDIHVTLDLQGRATTIAARYLPDGATTRADQLATTDVFDLLGRSWRHVRRDAQSKVDDEAVGGTTWVLPALDGQPLLRWDSRDQRFRTTFDALRRPTATFVQPGSGAETCLLFTRYGEEAPDAQAHHLYGQTWRVYDTAGLVTTEEVDVDGRVTQSTRRLVLAYHPLPDWSAMAADPDTATEPAWIPTADGTSTEVFTQTATFDLSGRPLHDTIGRDPGALHERRYGYDAGGRLTSVEVRLPAATAWTPVVHDITYNARGQREAVTSGNDAGAATLQSRYHYDPQSFRLLALQTGRLADTKVLQDLRYVHDAGGNITFIESRTDDTVYYDNAEVTPHRSFTYDALDRLITATGREHDSTYDPSLNFPGSRRQTGSGLGPVAHKADGAALRRYTQTYSYDAVGNFLELRHEQGGAGGATSVRTYAYEVEPDGTRFNNQLHSTTVGTTTYPLTYDLHGNMTTMSHLHAMAWDSLDRLQSVQTQLRTAPDPSDPPRPHPQHDWFYVYDGGGQRVRKVKAVLVEYDPTNAPGIVAADGEARQEERLYIGPFEIWRSYDGAGDTEDELETLHVMDGERRIAMVETVTWTDGDAVEDLEPKWRYQLDDHLGTSCGEVTEAGWVIGWEEYHPYGTTALWSFDGTREVSGKRYRYTGMERDEETCLSYHSSRYYLNNIQKWISCDSFGVADGLNSYCYCSSRPVSSFDPTGKYGEAGHYYVVLLVALRSGYDAKSAARLAFLSVLPDLVHDFDATQAALDAIGPGGEEHKRMAFDLHMLTGRAATTERVILQEFRSRFDTRSWQWGVLNHTFGDSYSHMVLTGENRLYGDDVGHLPDGHAPDEIWRRPTLAYRYAFDLRNQLISGDSRRNFYNGTSEEVLDRGKLHDALVSAFRIEDESDSIKYLKHAIAETLEARGMSVDSPDARRLLSFSPETIALNVPRRNNAPPSAKFILWYFRATTYWPEECAPKGEFSAADLEGLVGDYVEYREKRWHEIYSTLGGGQ